MNIAEEREFSETNPPAPKGVASRPLLQGDINNDAEYPISNLMFDWSIRSNIHSCRRSNYMVLLTQIRP